MGNSGFSCSYCSSVFKHKNSMYKHKKHNCKNNPEKFVEKNTKCQTNENMSKKLEYIVDNRSSTSVNTMQASNSDDIINKLIITINNQQKQMDCFHGQIMELKEQIKKLCDKSSTIQQTNIQNLNMNIQQNIVFLDEKFINLYDRKKELHGKEFAMNYIFNYIKTRNSNNKHDWLLDNEIIDRSKDLYPIKFLSFKDGQLEMDVQIKPDQVIKDNGAIIDKIKGNPF